jgi:hypothetical protein
MTVASNENWERVRCLMEAIARRAGNANATRNETDEVLEVDVPAVEGRSRLHVSAHRPTWTVIVVYGEYTVSDAPIDLVWLAGLCRAVMEGGWEEEQTWFRRTCIISKPTLRLRQKPYTAVQTLFFPSLIPRSWLRSIVVRYECWPMVTYLRDDARREVMMPNSQAAKVVARWWWRGEPAKDVSRVQHIPRLAELLALSDGGGDANIFHFYPNALHHKECLRVASEQASRSVHVFADFMMAAHEFGVDVESGEVLIVCERPFIVAPSLEAFFDLYLANDARLWTH